MRRADLLKRLDYERSTNFLRAGEGELEAALAYGHIFRRAIEKRGLRGVYTLRPPTGSGTMPVVPIVYVCEAESDGEADLTHRLVWNQDVVPFLIVQTPHSVRLYSGFQYQRRNGVVEGLLCAPRTPRELAALMEDFQAESIDSGAVWQKWGREVRPEGRVDWRLLDNLKSLDRWLQGNGELRDRVSHALIGKYVYLRYLRDRGILSDRKLRAWGLAKEQVFGRDASLPAFRDLIGRLDGWLNGAVFPIDFDASGSVTQDHLRRVAATFEGDELHEDGSWQLHLDFKVYDFSYIPIETLSVVYEQFLHTTVGTEATRGRDAGAYYTPIPVVNFMLAELSERRPLRPGMKVLDPSCGSGAFLVQCYRRLIETAFPPGRSEKPSPAALREILEQSLFGVDRDADACSVTELSLIITLLDYVDPPDLEDHPKKFKLPCLRDKNIFNGDFFAEDASWRRALAKRRFDWVVGNPPWKKLIPRKLAREDRPAWKWMAGQKPRGTPIGDNQVAQAFAWEAGELVADDGEVAFLLPAMILFEDPSRLFRKSFFSRFRVLSVANFANLTEVLFAGRSRAPAAAFFYSKRRSVTGADSATDEYIRTYSPLVANQEPTRPVVEGRRNETWSLVLNASEVRDVPLDKVIDGSGRPWKLAVWGSHLDEKLLDRLQRRFSSLGKLENQGILLASQGLDLRPEPDPEDEDAEEVEPVEEITDKNKLNPAALEQLRHIFAFPAEAIEKVDPERSYVRKGRASLPLSVCRPPHVIVGAARHYAIYTDEYLIVPPRQIGLISPDGNEDLLKAISLFLSSDFAFYHQFFTSTQLGIKRDVATLRALREIPLPVAALSAQELAVWAHLHSRLVATTLHRFETEKRDLFSMGNGAEASVEPLPDLLEELNQLVAGVLGLSDRERALIEDLVHVRLDLNDGKLGPAAVGPPDVAQMRRYARRLKADLDAFIEGELPSRHQVAVVYDARSAMVQVDLTRGAKSSKVPVAHASSEEADGLERIRARLRRQWSQWVYFDRDLRVFEDTRTYLFKPMQRFHWTESQAMFDAAEILAETLAGVGIPVD